VSTANRRREPKNLALRIMKMRNSDSLERRVRAMIARATATVPATLHDQTLQQQDDWGRADQGKEDEADLGHVEVDLDGSGLTLHRT
jgi:hypothetical protein